MPKTAPTPRPTMTKVFIGAGTSSILSSSPGVGGGPPGPPGWENAKVIVNKLIRTANNKCCFFINSILGGTQ